jgi:hypothetical protein
MGGPHDCSCGESPLHIYTFYSRLTRCMSSVQRLENSQLAESRKYDVNADQHPCELVEKYLGGKNAEGPALVRDAIRQWVVARGVEEPPVTWRTANFHICAQSCSVLDVAT